MNPTDSKKFIEIKFPVLKKKTGSVLRGAGKLASSTVKLPKAFLPIGHLLIRDEDINQQLLSEAIDSLFLALNQHPVADHSRQLTGYLRKHKLIPNEETTEGLIHYLVKQVASRSPVDIPEALIDEFWQFFQELIDAPELKGLVELNLEITRSVLRTYEPLLVDLINRTKHLRTVNQLAIGDMMLKARVLRSDLVILKRQIKAIRYIKPFLQTDPKDFSAQAQIVAQMVREFGPLFIKMAQVAAANADFLPEEIASELKVFQQDVAPMSGSEVNQAFLETHGKEPQQIYFDFDINRPLRSGSIGSVYTAKKPVPRDGQEILVPVIVKISRCNLEREFQMGALTLELMLISSQYWAPHSKLLPFLEAMAKQVKELTKGFEQELNFEDEAAIQNRFYTRSLEGSFWSVPKLFSVNGRILEMEYLDTAISVDQLVKEVATPGKLPLQRLIAEKFLYTVLQHILVYQEFHGDLHPGNILVTPEGSLFLIDWGNAVDMAGKWSLVWDYLAGVITADVDLLADALIAMSTQPTENAARRDYVRKALADTLRKKQVTPLESKPWLTLFHEGKAGLRKRLQTIAHLLSNTYQLGIIVQGDYLHLSRSLTAMVATYVNLYDGLPRSVLLADLSKGIALFPLKYLKDRVQTRLRRTRLPLQKKQLTSFHIRH
jgi:ubiquinone biosynthesis protein